MMALGIKSEGFWNRERKTEMKSKERNLQIATGMCWYKLAWKVIQNLDKEINLEQYCMLGWSHYTWNENILQKSAVKDLKLPQKKQSMNHMHSEQK